MSLRDYIQNNHWWKLVSLLLATLTWFTIHTALNRDQKLQDSPISTVKTRVFPAMPITIMTAASDARGFKISPEQVLVKVIGKEEKLATLLPQEIGVFVNLTRNQSAIRLRKDVQVRVPDGVIVVSVDPDKVDVEPIAPPETATTPRTVNP
ncbi:MAG: hypothetical protein HY298_01465 [Verrucomicrobia bacterium]|nr:hypothetical protein [Verrucomicrobiota bacterium]